MKTSIFNQSTAKLRYELKKQGISNKVLRESPNLYIFVNKDNTNDFSIELHKNSVHVTKKENYYMDFLPIAQMGCEFNVSDLVYYIRYELADYLLQQYCNN